MIHERVDTTNNVLIQIGQGLLERPLEKNFGFVNFKKYKLDNASTYCAFTKLSITYNKWIDRRNSEAFLKTNYYDKDNENDNDKKKTNK